MTSLPFYECIWRAAVTMLLNHIAHIFLRPGTTLSIAFTNIGYFTAITMCYFMVEGYGYTKSKKRYAVGGNFPMERILLSALIRLPELLTEYTLTDFYHLTSNTAGQ